MGVKLLVIGITLLLAVSKFSIVPSVEIVGAIIMIIGALLFVR